MSIEIYKLIGEATAYDKKQMLEVKRPKSWLKSVSAFANGEGGTLIFGISDDDKIVGIADAYQTKEFVKGNGEVFVKEFVKGSSKFAKEFVKASRQIYKLISQNPQINAVQMAESMGLSARQIQKYLRRLQELGKITRVGGRKTGEWKIIDEEYEGFFDRI